MGHDADTGGIFIDEHMVGAAVRAAAEEAGWAAVGEGDREQAGDDGILEPRGEGRIQQAVANEFRGPSLEAAMAELSPSRLGGGLDLGGPEPGGRASGPEEEEEESALGGLFWGCDSRRRV